MDMDGGALEKSEFSMLETRVEIHKLFELAPKELRVMVYEKVMEQCFEAGRQVVVSELSAGRKLMTE